jgi:hypothetical protein
MGTDDRFKIRTVERQSRISKELNKRAETWLIVCEGTKTEPNYFISLFNYANSKSNKTIKFKVDGTGKNTVSLVNSIDDYFPYIDQLYNSVNIPYGKVFAVFDKDSFTPEQFNNAIYKANLKGYIPIWSNECIELWFLLHFNLLRSNIPRNEYFKKIEDITSRKYDKSDDHFITLNLKDNIQTAVTYAKKLYNESIDEKSYALRTPCSTVFMIIEEIESYLEIKL